MNRHQNPIVPGLHQGDATAAATEAGKFDLLVLAAEEIQSPDVIVPRHVRVLDAGIDDARLSEREARIAEWAADEVARALVSGQAVLVTCFAGRNRSGLVAALALQRLGHSPREAVRLVRAARGPAALSNASFVRYIYRRI